MTSEGRFLREGVGQVVVKPKVECLGNLLAEKFAPFESWGWKRVNPIYVCLRREGFSLLKMR